MLLLNEEASIPLVPTLPADGKPPVVQYYKYPVVSALPTPVVNDQSWVLDSPRVEYKSVGGVWVAQSSITYAVWMWDGADWVPLIPEVQQLAEASWNGGLIGNWDGQVVQGVIL